MCLFCYDLSVRVDWDFTTEFDCLLEKMLVHLKAFFAAVFVYFGSLLSD